MNGSRDFASIARVAVLIFGGTLAAGSMTAGAGTTDLADIPLANATTVTLLPNIQFILDDSGSMGWDYMPDYVTDNYCRDNRTADNNMDAGLDSCDPGDPPYSASAFNGSYYNPMINYEPPRNADGSIKTPVDTTKNTVSPWDKVPKDGYKIQSTSSINLVTEFPERVACKNPTDDVNGGNCRTQLDASNNWIYPDATYDELKTRYGAPYYYNVTVEWCSQRDSSGTYKNFGKVGTCQTKKTSTYKYPRYTGWSRVNIVSTTTSYPGPNSTTRTYEQEMNNFANWYAWYRTRLQMMKTSVGLAFVDVRGTPTGATDDLDKFHARVGFTAISDTGATDGAKFLTINNFDATQKTSFYSKLYAQGAGSWTPLRGALMKAGKIYGGVLGTDPVQYSCQRNFTILSTDGYWNTDTETATYGPFKLDGSLVGDQDKDANTPSWDKLAKANTLADVAYYYYHTDLRPGTCTICTDNVPPSGTNNDVDDVAQHQHMTTFTIGLGVDGTLNYQDGYKTSTSGDYFDIVQGTKYWPDPIANSGDERIDDLWHAAVNGRGTYFSARDPASLVNGLQKALGAMEGASGSGAAAATSNLQPEVGDNYIYIANYRTVYWDGELSAYTIDLSNGGISDTATWQASALLDAKIGTAGDTDTRTIYTGESVLKNFGWATLTAGEQAYFNNSQLSQYADWDASQITAGTGENLLKYIRGHNRYEDQDRDASFGTYSRLYRDRAKILGDIVHGQPVYVQAARYGYADTGYSAYKTATATRAGTVYASANDGMLHAFDSENGEERWAYIPPVVMPDLWRLADDTFPDNHHFFLDGPMSVSDIYTGSAWKTILVGGLGKGGRGYYALDITDPSSPAVLWNYTKDNNENLGYSYGVPMVTKLADGTWVVVLTSGYNNVEPGDGKGYLFVLNAATGALIKTIETGEGNTGLPSGLARINLKVPDFELDNTAQGAYGGDLYGNMYAFDLEAGTSRKVISLGSDQPITAAPELGEIDGKTVLFFGTGRYLGSDDLDDTQTQAIYAVKDAGTTASKDDLQEQTLSTYGSSRSITDNPVDWSAQSGWYVNLPDEGERVHIEAQLYFGTLVVASIVPTADECQPGGYSWLYFLDYRSGSAVEGSTEMGQRYTSPIVGLTVAKLPGGTPVVYPITADGAKPPAKDLPIDTSGGGTGSGRRVMWRELVQ